MKYLEKLRMEVMIAQSRKNHTQYEMAEEIGIAQPTVSRFLSGDYEGEPFYFTIVGMCDYADLDPRPFLKRQMEID